MAYTITTIDGDATVVGTSAADELEAVDSADFDGAVQINSFEEDDEIDLSGGASSGTVGMGGGSDTVTISTADTSSVAFTLGDSTDTFTVTAAASDRITVGGQGGADTFTLNGATLSQIGGGQGQDDFEGTIGLLTTVRGGSEDDEVNFTAIGGRSFINGQVGEDVIDVTTGANNDVTIRGGSEDDEISVDTNGATGTEIYGDNGDDFIEAGAGVGDVLEGGEGDDTLFGGDGADELTGDAGDNAFVFEGAVGAADLENTVTDFGATGSDNAVDFTTNAATNVNVAAFEAVNVAGVAATMADGFTFVTSANDATALTTAAAVTYLGDADGGGNGFAFAASTDVGYIAITDGTDLGIFLADDVGGNTTIDAGDLNLIATLDDVTAITADDLVDFA